MWRDPVNTICRLDKEFHYSLRYSCMNGRNIDFKQLVLIIEELCNR